MKKETSVGTNCVRPEKGITLIALVITIIVLLILAGITLTLVMGENGLIAKAQEAGKNMTEAQNVENTQLANIEDEVNSKITGTRETSVADTELDFENEVDILQYNTENNYFRVEKSGIIIFTIGWGQKYACIYRKSDSGKALYFEGNSNSAANSVTPVNVYKGMNIWIDNNPMSAIYIPFKS